MEFRFTLDEVTEIVGEGRHDGVSDITVTGIASLETATLGDLSFLGNRKYQKQVATCRASLILLPESYKGNPRPDQTFLFVPSPSLALAKICGRIERKHWPKPAPSIHPTAIVDPTAVVDPRAHIGPYCLIGPGSSVGPATVLDSYVVLGHDVSIGSRCWLSSRVNVTNGCRLGNRIRLQSGVVVGSDGYGYEHFEGQHRRLPQIGNVIIEDDVDIGANTTIDRARFGVTRIGEGTKIDNLVQIAHNVIIGKHCLVVAQAGISGSTVLQDHVIIGGQAGAVGHITIGAGSIVGAQAGVINNLAPGSKVLSTPAYPITESYRVEILQRHLPDLFKRVKVVEKQFQSVSEILAREGGGGSKGV